MFTRSFARQETSRVIIIIITITRVGDTRGGNWGCHPSIFSWKPGDLFSRQFCGVTTSDFFSAITKDLFCSSLYIFLLVSFGFTPLEGVTPHLFLPVRPCFSTNLCKFAHKKIFFVRVSPPGGCHPGLSDPERSGDATDHHYHHLDESDGTIQFLLRGALERRECFKYGDIFRRILLINNRCVRWNCHYHISRHHHRRRYRHQYLFIPWRRQRHLI